MSELKPIELPDGSIVLMETDESVTVPEYLLRPRQDDSGFLAKGEGESIAHKVRDLAGTLESLMAFIPNAIKQAGGANVDKVILKFGVKLASEAGIPYLTKGSAGGSIDIEVQCSFPPGPQDAPRHEAHHSHDSIDAPP